MQQFLIGLAVVVGSSLLIWKRELIVRTFGYNAWAEQHFGSEGGTRSLYLLIGFFGVFIGLLVITGLWNKFIGATLGSILPN